MHRAAVLKARHFPELVDDPDKYYRLVLEQTIEKDLKEVRVRYDREAKDLTDLD